MGFKKNLELLLVIGCCASVGLFLGTRAPESSSTPAPGPFAPSPFYPTRALPPESAPSEPQKPTTQPWVKIPAEDRVGVEKAKEQPGYFDVMKLRQKPPVNNAQGRELFAMNCAACHGEKGCGDGPASEALDPRPRNLPVKTEFKYGTGELAMFRTVKYGVQGSGMAPWDVRMTDEECWQVVYFVKTLQAK